MELTVFISINTDIYEAVNEHEITIYLFFRIRAANNLIFCIHDRLG